MRGSLLCCATVTCNAHFTALHYTAPSDTALHCTPQYYTALHPAILHPTALHCTLPQFTKLSCTPLDCAPWQVTTHNCTVLEWLCPVLWLTHLTRLRSVFLLQWTALHCTVVHCILWLCSLGCSTQQYFTFHASAVQPHNAVQSVGGRSTDVFVWAAAASLAVTLVTWGPALMY